MWDAYCNPFLQIESLPFSLPTHTLVSKEIDLMKYINEFPVGYVQWEAPAGDSEDKRIMFGYHFSRGKTPLFFPFILLVTLKSFWSSAVWGDFPTPGNYWTPAGCPTIQLNCDSIFLLLVLDPIGSGLSHSRLLPLSYRNGSSGCYLNQEFLPPPPQVWSFARIGHNSKENSLLTKLPVYTQRNKTQDQPDERDALT